MQSFKFSGGCLCNSHILIIVSVISLMGFPCGSASKESACNVGDLGSIPDWEDILEKGKVTNSSTLDCIVHGSQRVGHVWVSFTSLHFSFYAWSYFWAKFFNSNSPGASYSWISLAVVIFKNNSTVKLFLLNLSSHQKLNLSKCVSFKHLLSITQSLYTYAVYMLSPTISGYKNKLLISALTEQWNWVIHISI